MHNKTTLQKNIIHTIVMIVIAAFVFTILILSVVLDQKEGWTNDKTIALAYAIIAPLIGFAFFRSLYCFLVGHNKGLINAKTQIHRILSAEEKTDNLMRVESAFLQADKNEAIRFINEILSSKSIEQVSFETIDHSFDEFGRFKYEGKLRFYERFSIQSHYERTKISYSSEFNELYRKYKNNELVAKPHFPFLEMLLPLIASLIGLFATLYQTMAAETSLSNALVDYIKVTLAFLAYSGAIAIYGLRSGVESEIKAYKSLLLKIQSASPLEPKANTKKRTRKKTKKQNIDKNL